LTFRFCVQSDDRTRHRVLRQVRLQIDVLKWVLYFAVLFLSFADIVDLCGTQCSVFNSQVQYRQKVLSHINYYYSGGLTSIVPALVYSLIYH
jgi:hypothetical protein